MKKKSHILWKSFFVLILMMVDFGLDIASFAFFLDQLNLTVFIAEF